MARSCCATWLIWSCRYSKSPSGQPLRMHLTVLHEHVYTCQDACCAAPSLTLHPDILQYACFSQRMKT